MSTINLGALSETINNKADRDLKNRSIDSGFRKLVDSYIDAASWYKVYAEIQNDGTVKYWCEQGNISEVTSGYGSVALLLPYLDTNYTVIAVQDHGTSIRPSFNNADIVAVDSKTTTAFRLLGSTNADTVWSGTVSWVSFGYIALTEVAASAPIMHEVVWAQPFPSGSLGGDTFAVYTDAEVREYCTIDRGFHGATAPYTAFLTTMSFTSGNFIFYNPNPLKVTRITFTNINSENYAAASGEIYGSNDNENWTLITPYSAGSQYASATWSVDMTNNTSFYKYYKVTCDHTGGYYGSFTGSSSWGFTDCTITATVMQ